MGAALEVVLVVLLVELADVVTLVDSGAGVDSGAPHAVSRSTAVTMGNSRLIMMRVLSCVGFATFLAIAPSRLIREPGARHEAHIEPLGFDSRPGV